MKILLLLPAFLIWALSIHCQDKILLMNGSEMDCRIVGDSGTVVVFELKKKSGKTKTREVHKSDVFSITRSSAPERVLYIQDSLFGDIYTIDQMRMYLAGQRDGRALYRAMPTAVVGFLICGAAAYAGGDGVLTATAPPILYMLVQLAPRIHIREKYMSNVNYKYNEIYASGFEPPARTRKILSALSGGYLGSAAGVLIYFIRN
ncbi:MAG: hypothetical protein ACK5XV_11190 [Flavobacteriales bacterium]|jgi:hypothetical protein